MKPTELNMDNKKRLRRKNIAMLLGLLALCIIFYGLALIRFKQTLG